LKTFLFEEGPDSGGLIALKLDAALSDGAAAAAGVAESSAQLLDGSEAEVRREIVNHDDHFAPAMRRFAPQHHATRFRFAGGGLGRPVICNPANGLFNSGGLPAGDCALSFLAMTSFFQPHRVRYKGNPIRVQGKGG